LYRLSTPLTLHTHTRSQGENRHLRSIVQQTAFELQQARTELQAARQRLLMQGNAQVYS
jgi:hypothetical protein